MNTDLGRRLQDLASDAPPNLPSGGLWESGLGRRRKQRAAGVVAAVLAVVALVGGLQVARDIRGDGPPPAGPPTGIGHLPRTIHAPSAWSDGTADAGELGVLAVVDVAERKRPVGLTGMVTYESLYGISAVDGTARFLDIPVPSEKDMPGRTYNVTLSPDGRKVGYSRYVKNEDAESGLLGWAVYDTTTGEVTDFGDLDQPSRETVAFQIVFSSDSRYLLTDYAPSADTSSKADSFVAWDVETGERIVVEKPGHYWLPNVGSGPDGIVWSRGNRALTFDPVSRKTTSLRTEHEQVMASYAPTGTAFAYVGGVSVPDGISTPWKLYVGPSPDRLRSVPGIDDAGGIILGWRDPAHVVVALDQQEYVVVDVDDATFVRERLRGPVNVYSTQIAADLWANDLVPGVRPPQAADPQRIRQLVPWLLGSAVLAGLVVFVLVRRRRRD